MNKKDDSISWPPAYTLTKSTRAKHVRLKASVRKGLELVVPTRFNPKHIPEILEKHKEWITKNLLKIQHKLADASETDLGLPTEIRLTAITETWLMHYIKTRGKTVKLMTRPSQEIVLVGDITQKALCKKVLAGWLKKQGEKHLLPRLEHLSKQCHLPYSAASIRGQRSRWGSCSVDKDISLNYKLLFLPSALADHILVHELCHTMHLNHSTAFWRLVAKNDPHWKQHCKEIKTAEKYVPTWLEIDYAE